MRPRRTRTPNTRGSTPRGVAELQERIERAALKGVVAAGSIVIALIKLAQLL